MSEYKFLGNLILTGKIRCKTALHIGGSKDAYEIGGMDNPVIKTIRDVPYIPGSSLKGKLRSLLEWSLDLVPSNNSKDLYHVCDDQEQEKYLNCPVCRVFGTPAEKEKGFCITRLVVRDAFLSSESENELNNLGSTTEIKTENMIHRLSGKAEHPRPIERVPEGTEFEFSMVYSVYEIPDEPDLKDLEFFPHVLDAMALLEDSYLGGMGSRGSGQVEFKELKLVFRGKDYYLNGKPEKPYKPDESKKLHEPKEPKETEEHEKTEPSIKLRMNEKERSNFIEGLDKLVKGDAKNANTGPEA